MDLLKRIREATEVASKIALVLRVGLSDQPSSVSLKATEYRPTNFAHRDTVVRPQLMLLQLIFATIATFDIGLVA